MIRNKIVVLLVIIVCIVSVAISYRLHFREPVTIKTLNISSLTAIIMVGGINANNTKEPVREQNNIVSYDISLRLDFRANFEKYPCRVEVETSDGIFKSFFISKNDTVLKVPNKHVSEIRYYVDNKLISTYYYYLEPKLWNLSAIITANDSLENESVNASNLKLAVYVSNYPLQPPED